MKFSIVTPSLSQSKYIPETIESVLSQAGNFEIEYFVIDGGSTDGSIEIIKSYATRVATGEWPIKCKNISMEWISEKDKGQSNAINKGLHKATGNILSYINSDDLYYPNAFEKIVEAFNRYKEVDFVYGDGDVIDEIGNLKWEWLSRPYKHRIMTTYHFLWNDFTNYIMQQATFWRKEVIDKIGYFDEDFHYAMDVEYWIRAGHKGLRLYHITEKLGKFRLIEGTKSLSNPTIFWADQLEIFRRYRGAHCLGVFFAYYYYNLARQVDFDLSQIPSKQNFPRWQMLSQEEQEVIQRQAKRGFALSCILIADDLRRKQRKEESWLIFKKALSIKRLFSLHPLGLTYLIKHLLGPYLSNRCEHLADKLIQTYRRVRFDYRYYQPKNIK